MKFKNKRSRKVANADLPWKAMPIECEDGLDGEDFAGLVALEELDGKEYAMKRGENIGKVVVYAGKDKNNNNKTKTSENGHDSKADKKKEKRKNKDRKKKEKKKKEKLALKNGQNIEEDNDDSDENVLENDEDNGNDNNNFDIQQIKSVKRKAPILHRKENNIKKKKIINGSGFVVTSISDNDDDDNPENDQDQEEEEDDDDDDDEEKGEEEEASDEAVENINPEDSEWKSLSIPNSIIRRLLQSGMKTPTEIQKLTIPSAIQERQNIFGAAPTGSGKTLAFGIPLVANILEDRKADNNSKHLRGLILTPTRELAVQIKKHIENITKGTQIQTALIVGGLAIQKQERILEKFKPEIVVATPGRFWQILESGKIKHLTRASLKMLKYLIIDEADRMVEKSHFDELGQIVAVLNDNGRDEELENIKKESQKYDKKSTNNEGEEMEENDEEDPEELEENFEDNGSTTPNRQYLIFSATLTMFKKSEKSLNSKKNRHKKNPNDQQNLMELLQLNSEDLKFCDLTEGGQKSQPNAEKLTEKIVHTMKDDKDAYLYYFLLSNPGRTIIFCNSIDCIRRLINIFRFLQLQAIVVHSSMPQKRRLNAIEKFTDSKNCILLATDVASRGLDIPGINHVVHYQVPRSAEIYIHRSGRTARINNTGLSLILCEPQEEAWFLRNIKKVLNKDHIDEFETNSLALKKIKDRLVLANKCDHLEHSLRKLRLTDDWFRANRKACEMDDSDDELPDDPDDNLALAEKNDASRKLKQLQNQLKATLKIPIKFNSKKA